MESFISYVIDLFNLLLERIFEILSLIDTEFKTMFFSIFFEYLFLLLLFSVLLTVTSRIITLIRLYLLKPLYLKLIREKNFYIIRFTSELYYLLDKTLDILTPKVINSAYIEINSINTSRVISPIAWFTSLKSLFLQMINITILNIIIWITILLFYYPQIMEIFDLSSVWNNIKQLDYKTISSIIGFLTLLLSFLIVLLFRSTFFASKAKRKIYEDNYEQVIKHQNTILNLLIKCQYSLEENINDLSEDIDILTNEFCEDLSNSFYSWVNHSLLKDKNRKWKYIDNETTLFDKYKTTINEIKKIEKCLNEINENHQNNIYNKLNKSISYEIRQLNVTPNSEYILFVYSLVDRMHLENLYKNTLKKFKNINRRYKDIETWNQLNQVFSRDLLIQHEAELNEAITEYRNLLKKRLEQSVYYYIINEQLINYSYKKTKLNIFDLLFGK